MPQGEGVTRYELHLDETLTIARTERDPSPEVTADIDDCVEKLFVGQRPPATDPINPYHFTLSYRRSSPRAAPSLAEDLERLCGVAGPLGPGGPLAALVTAWSVDARGTSILGPDAEALRAAVEREPRERLYAAIVREAAARGVPFTCPGLEGALRPE